MCTYHQIVGAIDKLTPIYINNNKILINQLDDNLKHKISMISMIKVYGDIGNPKYSLKDIAKLLDIKEYIKMTDHFDEDERMRAITINNNSHIPKKKYLLTEDGLQRIIYQSNSPIGKLFRKCVKFVFDELLTEKVVALDQLEKHIEKNHMNLYKKTVITLKKKVEQLQEKNTKIKQRLEFSVQLEEEQAEKIKSMQNSLDVNIFERTKIKKKIKLLEQEYASLEKEANHSIDYLQKKELITLQEKYTKPIYIYMEEIPFAMLRKKYADESKDDIISSLGIKTYSFSDIDEDGIFFSDVMLYNIFKKKQTRKSRLLAHTMYGSSDEIFEILHNILYNINNPYTNIMLDNYLVCSIEDIKMEYEDIILKRQL